VQGANPCPLYSLNEPLYTPIYNKHHFVVYPNIQEDSPLKKMKYPEYYRCLASIMSKKERQCLRDILRGKRESKPSKGSANEQPQHPQGMRSM